MYFFWFCRVSCKNTYRVSSSFVLTEYLKFVCYRVSNVQHLTEYGFAKKLTEYVLTYRVCFLHTFIEYLIFKSYRVCIWFGLVEYLKQQPCRVWKFCDVIEYHLVTIPIEYHLAWVYRVSPLQRAIEYGFPLRLSSLAYRVSMYMDLSSIFKLTSMSSLIF